MATDQRDVAYVLADHVVKTKYEDIPPEALEATKKDILDTLGTTLAGSTADGVKQVYDLVTGWGGKKESSILSFGDKVPSLNAAFMNGTAAHARDYDDIHEAGVVHAGVSAIPALLATAEAKGKVTGREFIAATAIGVDLMCRLAMASGSHPAKTGLHNTAIFGIFGSTAACGKLLGFDLEKMINALGIAYSQCAGNIQCVADGALVKRMHAGFTAKAAVLSALLAGGGYTGAHNIFEGKYGLFNVYYKGYDRKKLLADLGKTFEISNISFKPYPSCRATHPSIDAALALATEHNINPEEISKIVIHHGPTTLLCLEPIDVRKKPKVVVDGQFSIPYTAARAFVQRKVGLSDFDPEEIQDQAVLDVAQKFEMQYDPELTKGRACEPVVLDVHLAGNKVYSTRIDFAKGDPENPLDWSDLCDKFRDCASHSVKPLTKTDVERVIEFIRNLEQLEDIRKIVALLA